MSTLHYQAVISADGFADGSVAPSLRYDVALLYLKNADWNLEKAIQSYQEDEQWEKEHPLIKMLGKRKLLKDPKMLACAVSLAVGLDEDVQWS